MKEIQVKIEMLTYAKSQVGKYVVVLADNDRKLPVILYSEDAQDLAVAIEGISRIKEPSCVGLFKTMVEMSSTLDKTPTSIEKLVVYDCEMGLFMCKLILTNGNIILTKLGYGLVIATTFKCPIFVTENVMEICAVDMNNVENIKKVEMDIFDRIDEKLKTANACQFKTGKQSKRINGEWEVRYGWELFDANDRRISGSEWEGFESLEEALEDMLKYID